MEFIIIILVINDFGWRNKGCLNLKYVCLFLAFSRLLSTFKKCLSPYLYPPNSKFNYSYWDNIAFIQCLIFGSVHSLKLSL